MRSPAPKSLEQDSLNVLKEIFDATKSTGEGVDSVVFRAQHEDRINLLDLLERNGYLRKDNDKYWVTLVGLKMIGDSTTKEYFAHFEKIFSALRKHYKSTPKKELKVVNLASIAGLTFEETAECLSYMIEGMWWAGRSNDLKDPEAIIKPSESILKYKTSHDVIAQLIRWRDEREAQDSALRKDVGKNSARAVARFAPDPEQAIAADQELIGLAQSIAVIEGRFVTSQSGKYLRTEDEAEFKRLVVEAKSILDSELGRVNDFSSNLIHAVNTGSGGYFGGPSCACVKEARALIEGAVNHIRRRPALTSSTEGSKKPSYVEESRLVELHSLTCRKWDFARLVRLCEELNIAYEHDCHMAAAMVVRAIVDHVPPVFGYKSFGEVVSNYPGAKSFHGSMKHLDGSLRNVADAHLHIQIRNRESVPTPAQVDFRADVDVLLAEIVRLMK